MNRLSRSASIPRPRRGVRTLWLGWPLLLATAPPLAAPEPPTPPANPPAGPPGQVQAPVPPASAPPTAPAPGGTPAPPSTPTPTTTNAPAPTPPAAPPKPKPPEASDLFPPSEVVKLTADGTSFEGLFRETPARRIRGTILLLHGRSSAANDQAVVDPLRVRLPERGWSSLSLVLPDTPPGQAQALEQAEARVKAGVDFLKGKNLRALILLGHDQGVRTLLGYLLKQADPAVKAAVVIDPVPGIFAPGSGIGNEQAARLRLPVLDLRTGRDIAVLGEEARLWRVAFRGDPGYRQSVLNDPHPDWKDMEEFVENRVHGWLVRLQQSADPGGSVPIQDTADAP